MTRAVRASVRKRIHPPPLIAVHHEYARKKSERADAQINQHRLEPTPVRLRRRIGLSVDFHANRADQLNSWNQPQHGKGDVASVEADEDQRDASLEIGNSKGSQPSQLIACGARGEIESGDMRGGIIQHDRVHEPTQQVVATQQYSHNGHKLWNDGRAVHWGIVLVYRTQRKTTIDIHALAAEITAKSTARFALNKC